MCDFITQSSNFRFLEQFANSVILCSAVIFGSSLRSMVKNEISSDTNWEKAFWETAFRCVNATLRLTRFSSVFTLLTQFSRNLQWDTSECNEACGDKGNALRWKLEGRFVRNFLVMRDFISQSYTYVSCSTPLSLFLRNLRRSSLDRTEAYADKGNIISSKSETSVLRNLYVICEFLSQSYSLVLRKQLANSLFVESPKQYLRAHCGPMWKRNYPQIITREKLAERLLSEVGLHHVELNPSLLGTVC